MTIDVMVDKYIKLRDKRDAIRDEHKAQLKPYAEAMAMLEGLLLSQLNGLNLKNMTVEAGTVYTSVSSSVKVVRWSETIEYIRQNELWELLEARVNKTAAQAIMDELQQAIPGVDVTREVEVHVRRS